MLPAAVFPCIGTESPESPGSREMEGLSHKTHHSLQPGYLAGPGKALSGLDPVLCPQQTPGRGMVGVLSWLLPTDAGGLVPIIPLPPRLPQEGF